jgi:hypothetical protein
MVLYPFTYPLILSDSIFTDYGGKTGTFTSAQRQSSYLIAEMQVSSYIGTLLLPTNVTGTYPFMNTMRLATDYGYVQELNNVSFFSKTSLCGSCSLTSNDGCGYIYQDTFGYIDVEQTISSCGACSCPYQIQISYKAGLPTGTASSPPFLEALTILAQIDLNEKDPGNSGINETTGDLAVQSYKSLDYSEERGAHSLVKTALGESAKAMRAKRLIDMSITRARKVLLA